MDCTEALKHHARCGIIAENYFLQACKNLGFKEVNNNDKMIPLSIRRATNGEEGKLIDFVLRLPGYIDSAQKKYIPVVPLQLTLMWFESHYLVKRKLEAAAYGEIALIWADGRLGRGKERHQKLYNLLKDAASGKTEALKEFLELFEEACSYYLKKAHQLPQTTIDSAFASFAY